MKKLSSITEQARSTIGGGGKPLKMTGRAAVIIDIHKIDAGLSDSERTEPHCISHLGFLMLLSGRPENDRRLIRDLFKGFKFEKRKRGKWENLPAHFAAMRKVFGDRKNLAAAARLRHLAPETYGQETLDYLVRRERFERARQRIPHSVPPPIRPRRRLRSIQQLNRAR
jgi:hypothetical protein